ncbi:hypothetical protein HD553DRAFT_335769 [Filobasidium floriforme]|uniref:uncharacterized protein n=1 Tax=Filobasidium floriforme TaxID=5210 RepID=UPI001E8EDE6F|nr:uncharacterized protein HD553DRAFT_335769 [Filobasidium floriforme]KAH8083686.1 hypothetical protein HD553DRAFT_335769 [Filobasidium floriforme]
MPGFINRNNDGSDDDAESYGQPVYAGSVHSGYPPSIPTEASSDGQRPNTAESYGQSVRPESIQSGHSGYPPSIPTGTGGPMRLPAGYQPGLDGYHQFSSAWSNTDTTSESSRPPTSASQGQQSSRGGAGPSRPQTGGSQGQYSQGEASSNAGQDQESDHIRRDWLARRPPPPPGSRRAAWQTNTDGTTAYDPSGQPIWVVQEYVPNAQGNRSWVNRYYTQQAATDAGEYHQGTTASSIVSLRREACAVLHASPLNAPRSGKQLKFLARHLPFASIVANEVKYSTNDPKIIRESSSRGLGAL